MGLKIFILLLVFIFGYTSSSFACTSFALYGSQVFYGMNFDYFAVPLKFLIESGPGMNVFHLSFLYEQTVKKPEFKNYFAKTCGMNDKGLFCACQEIEPYSEGIEELSNNEIHIGDQYDTISTCADVDGVQDFIKGKKAVQYIGPSVHNLFADINGNAIVTETDNKNNFLTGMEGDFMVMSNFANHSLAGRSYGDADGSGADRYKTACEYLSENKDTFSVDKGFDLLEKVICREEDCTTLSSMVFLPRRNRIYISLNRNYGKIWEVSLDRKTIGPYKGGDTDSRVSFGAGGILSTDLR